MTSFISQFYKKKYISDQTNLQQLWRSAFSRSFWQKIDKSNICILFELL